MKKSFVAFLGFILLMTACSKETDKREEPPFFLDLSLTQNEGQMPPIYGVQMGSRYIFNDEYPGEPTEIPEGIRNGKILHGITDIPQYIAQGTAAGFVDSSVYRQSMQLIKEQTVTDDWVDVILTIALGQDEAGNTMAFVENESGEFNTVNPVYFSSDSVTYQQNTFEVMSATISASVEYFNGTEIVRYTEPAQLLYLPDTKPEESLQLYFKKLRTGTWTVNDQTFDVALSKESAPPYRIDPYTYLYIDIDKDGIFDVNPNGYEAYPVTEAFYIAGESWMITGISLKGDRVRIDKSIFDANPKASLRPGMRAPDFETESISGEKISLEDYRGKYVLLDFWGTWCGPCLDALPTLKKVHEEFGGDRFEIIGIANELSLEGFEMFIETEQIQWPQILELYEQKSEIQDLYSVNTYPTYYLINPEGRIAEYGVALSPENLEKTLERYLNGN